jgi:hypothetical protein
MCTRMFVCIFVCMCVCVCVCVCVCECMLLPFMSSVHVLHPPFGMLPAFRVSHGNRRVDDSTFRAPKSESLRRGWGCARARLCAAVLKVSFPLRMSRGGTRKRRGGIRACRWLSCGLGATHGCLRAVELSTNQRGDWSGASRSGVGKAAAGGNERSKRACSCTTVGHGRAW